MANQGLVEAFTAWASGREDLEPDVADTLVDLKTNYLGDPQPGRWREGDLSEILLELIPRKVSADAQWFDAVIPTTRAFLTWAHGNGRLHRGSSPLAALLHEVDVAAKDFDEAIHDSSRFGMAKSLFAQMLPEGADLAELAADPAALQALVDRHNALPFEARKAATDPALIDRAQRLPRDQTFPVSGGAVSGGAVSGGSVSGGEDERRVLPAVRIASVSALAQDARQSPTIHELATFMAWLGERRSVTSTGVLTLKEARSACEALGWPAGPDEWAESPFQDDEPAARDVQSARDMHRLHRLWRLAELSGVIEVRKTRVYPGLGVADLDAVAQAGPDGDARVVELWGRLFTALFHLGPYGGLEVMSMPIVEELAELAAVHALIGAYTDGPIDVDDLVEGVIRPEIDAADSAIAELIESLATGLLHDQLGRFAALGALSLETDEDEDGVPFTVVELTALGTYGVREVVQTMGFDAPVAASAAGLDAPAVVAEVASASPSTGSVLAAEWFAARSREGAVAELLGYARTSTAAERQIVLVMLDEALGDDLPAALATVDDDPLLGPVGRAYLAVRAAQSLDTDDSGLANGDQPSLLSGDVPALSEAEGFLLFAEMLAAELGDASEPVRTSALDSAVWGSIDEGVVAQLAASSHPERRRVVAAIGTGHPSGRVRKAAKKAAHKLSLTLVPRP